MARGMANNEPIVSQAQTDEWDEGYARTFGERPTRQPGRRSYVYRGGRMVERGGPDDTGFYDEADEARFHVVSDLYMIGAKLPGTDIDIGSRRKRREVMRAEGIHDADDHKQEWAAAAERRRRFLAGEALPDPARREAVGRAMYEAEKRRSKRR